VPERFSACPGDEVSFTCNIGDEPVAAWTVSCHMSSPEASCQPVDVENIEAEKDRVANRDLCKSEAVANSIFMFSLDFPSEESNLNITIPRHTMITHLVVGCPSTCRIIQVAGELTPPTHIYTPHIVCSA
jgi:hypothetical protein